MDDVPATVESGRKEMAARCLLGSKNGLLKHGPTSCSPTITLLNHRPSWHAGLPASLEWLATQCDIQFADSRPLNARRRPIVAMPAASCASLSSRFVLSLLRQQPFPVAGV